MNKRPKIQEDYCAIDFGTSNSSLAVCIDHYPTLIALEGASLNLPTALFYPSEPGEEVLIGRAAVAAYMAFEEGRLLRSIKSVLGSSLMGSTTELGPGWVMGYTDIIADFLSRIKFRAEKATGKSLAHALIGRPAFFVDDNPEQDAQAQVSLEEAALKAGFKTVAFEYEPVAAALAFASTLDDAQAGQEQIALVADIGGGTSDFSIIQLNAEGSRILANHGVHVAGTDFDRRVSLHCIMPLLGLGATNPNGRAVPNSIYRELATWHQVNGLYTQKSKASLFTHRDMYGSKVFYERLSKVLSERLGHQLLAEAEQGKIRASDDGQYLMHLNDVERGLQRIILNSEVAEAIDSELSSIGHAAHATIAQAGLTPDQITALYFTGGSTGLRALRESIARVVPQARASEGERFESVAFGLGIAAVEKWANE
jgi:hypothetical chaperone protein